MKLLTSEGLEHGLIRKIRNSVQEDKCKRDPKQKAEYEKKREHDSKRVRARYINRESENGEMMKPYVRYAGDPIEIYRFISNFVYEVPMGLVEEVNASEFQQQPNEEHEDNGRKTASKAKAKKVHEFVPVGF